MLGEHFGHDVGLAWRGLMRSKAFTAAAVLTMAVGICGTTAMFALIRGVLLRPMPVRDHDRLIVGWKASPRGGFAHWPFHVAELEAIGQESRLLENVAGVGYVGAWPEVAVENGEAAHVSAATVTGSFFDALGVPPVLGRVLQPADDQVGAERVLVITHGLWQRRYGGARDVIGRRLTMRDVAFTIVGVMPRDFAFPPGVEAWATLEGWASVSPNPTYRDTLRRENDLVARVRAGATRERVLAELEGMVTRLEAETRFEMPRGMRPVVRSYEDMVVGDLRPAMLVLFGAVGLLLLIAGANVANLLLVRGEGRRTEMALRAALGATRGRIASQLLAESLVLAGMAGLAGLAGAAWLLRVVVAVVPGGLTRVESVRIDGAAVLFTIALAFFSAALAGLAPVLYAARTDLAAQLRSGRQPGGGGARRGRRALVMAQVALAVTVVAAASLLTRSLLRLQAADMGMRAERLLLVDLILPETGEDERAPRRLRLLDELMARLRAVPAIEDATPITTPPFAGALGWDAGYGSEAQSEEEAKANPSVTFEAVYPNHFATLGIPVLRGRGFDDRDRPGAPEVAVVSEDVAARLWPGRDPIGQRIKLADAWRNVVGVVAPTRYRELAVVRPTLYLPAPQFMVSPSAVMVRTALQPAVVAGLLRGQAQALDPGVRVMSAVPFGQLLAAPLARPRFNAFLIGLFAAASLLLAAVGLYAVIAAYVRSRHLEIGIRLTLGATPAGVSRLVLGEGLRLAVAGAVIGLAIAVGAGHLVKALLFEASPLDPASLLGAAALLVGAAALACYLPARQATRVDPAAVLRAS